MYITNLVGDEAEVCEAEEALLSREEEEDEEGGAGGGEGD